MFEKTLRQTTREIGRNNVSIRMAAPLQNLSITLRVVASEKVSFSDTQYPKTVC